MSSRLLKMDGEISLALLKASAYGSRWAPGEETDFSVMSPPQLDFIAGYLRLYNTFAPLMFKIRDRVNLEQAHGHCSRLSHPLITSSGTHMSSAQAVSIQSSKSPLQVNSASPSTHSCDSPNSSGSLALGVLFPAGSHPQTLL